MRVRNLLNQPENVFVGLGFIDGLPDGCQIVDFSFKEIIVGPLARKTVELEHLISCDPNIAVPGRYNLNIEVLAFPMGGADLDESNNFVEKTVRLRLRG